MSSRPQMVNGGVGAVPVPGIDPDSGAQHKSRFGFLRGRKKSSDADKDFKNGNAHNASSISPPPLVTSQSVESFQNHSRVFSSTRALPPLPIQGQRSPSDSSSKNSTPNSVNGSSANAYAGSFGPLRMSPQVSETFIPTRKQSSHENGFDPYDSLPNPYGAASPQQTSPPPRRLDGMPEPHYAPVRRAEGLPRSSGSPPPTLPPIPQEVQLSQQLQQSPEFPHPLPQPQPQYQLQPQSQPQYQPSSSQPPPQFLQAPSRRPTDPFDKILDRHHADFLDGQKFEDSLDRKLAESFVISSGLATLGGGHSGQDKKNAMKKVGEMMFQGTQHMSRATLLVEQFTASPVYTEGKEIAMTMLEPAKDMMAIMEIVASYVPMVLAAKAIFSAIVKVELERHENDKNVSVVCLTMTSFWYTLCDLKVVFESPEKLHRSMEGLVNDVSHTMEEFGNFKNHYFKQNHMARTFHSTSYKAKLTGYADTFKKYQADLQFLLSEHSALTITKVDQNVQNLSEKMEAYFEKVNMLIAMKSPLEERVEAKIQAVGGTEVALRDNRFLRDVAENDFRTTFTPQLRTALKMDIEDSLKANMAMFKLQIKDTQRQIDNALERSTDMILLRMESGPHELIKDEDIKALWKDMNWRISCKTRHFVDSLYHHFTMIFAKHRKATGEPHQDQWTLKFMGKVIFQPTIADAIDEDGSGYVSVHEVNHFVNSKPCSWSVPVLLAYCAAGWYNNSVEYHGKCLQHFDDIVRRANRLLHPNKKHFKSYFSTGCLPEVWTILNSLNTETLRYRGDDMRTEFEILGKFRGYVMEQTLDYFQLRLESVKYRIDTAEGVIAVMGTPRVEVYILPLLCLVLERHAKILELAENLVLSEMEFQTMINSIQNLVIAFGTRYSNIITGWRQQRVDVSRQVRTFASGMFESWYGKFHEASLDTLQPNSPTRNNSIDASHVVTKEKPSVKPTDLLAYGIPKQPASEELRRLRLSARNKVKKAEDGWAKDRYGHASQRIKSKSIRRSHRRSNGMPRTPTIKLQHEPPSPLLKAPTTIYEMEGDHLVPTTENDGYESVDSSELPELVVEQRTAKPTNLEDKLKSVEAELVGMKEMMVQLLVLSKQNSAAVAGGE